MSKTKAAALTLVFASSALFVACAGETPKTPPPPTNTATAPTNKPADPKPAEMKVAGMPADVQPIFAAKCAMCHGPDATGKGNAPNILQVKDKHTAAEWEKYLENPKSLEPDSKMPPVASITPEDRKKVAEWLAATTGGGAASSAEKPAEKAGEKPVETKK